ncbi:hypothetical protein P43SY_010236 [Pythium insidiosum]|uniref:Uncharacterized protein n=1 Tax=Pythium insidiosum TaxID=114742 RepID=A0AAD5Q1K7_PYTIN|nr:hypothetical protein P43SY_010236 [Pythium insidiosum]KAJ0392298.1 hypothetical protein ATCC90586_001709 [Pythium insidiosum]
MVEEESKENEQNDPVPPGSPATPAVPEAASSASKLSWTDSMIAALLRIRFENATIRQKYAKLKSEYKRHTEDTNRTGNNAPRTQTAVDEDESSSSHESSSSQRGQDDAVKHKAGVNFLASEVGRGLTAIAGSLSRANANSNLVVMLRAQHEQQLALTNELVSMQRAQNELLLRLLDGSRPQQ